MDVLDRIHNAVYDGNVDILRRVTMEAIEKGHHTQMIIDDGFIHALDVVGEEFSSGTLFLPEMLMAAKAVKAGLDIIEPLIKKSELVYKGKMVIGTVEGDVHDIGKNLVCMMMQGAGFEVTDLGVDVCAEDFIECAKEKDADMIGISALLSPMLDNMERTVREIRNHIERNIKIVVGGAPVTQDFADWIEADGYAPDAGLAVKMAKEILGIVS